MFQRPSPAIQDQVLVLTALYEPSFLDSGQMEGASSSSLLLSSLDLSDTKVYEP